MEADTETVTLLYRIALPGANGAKWISKFIPHFKMDVIIYSCWDIS